MTSIQAIQEVVGDIRSRRNSWQLSLRPVNLKTLDVLGITQDIAFSLIWRQLTWQDYISGPVADNHVQPIPGDIWVFGLTIEHQPCYLKFQDKPSGIVMWISLHIADYELRFPYRS